MDTSKRPGAGSPVLPDIAFILGFGAAQALTALAIRSSWGHSSWQFGAGAGIIVAVIALFRRFQPLWAPLAGIVVATAAVVVAQAKDLPREPGPGMVLALAVLVVAAIRLLPSSTAMAVAVAGLAVPVVAVATEGTRIMALVACVGWVAAVAAGTTLRRRDDSPIAGRENPRPNTRPVYNR